MSRLFKIAWRDYLAYVRTPGFWLSILLMPVGIGVFGFAQVAVQRSSPVPAVAVVDFTGQPFAAEIAKGFAAGGRDEKPDGRMVAAPGGPYADPAAATAGLRPYVGGDKTLKGGGALDAAVIIRPQGGGVAVDIWSRNVTDPTLERSVRRSVAAGQRRAGLERAGVSPETLKALDALTPKVALYSPKGRGEVSLRDKLPGIVGFGTGFLLWMVVFTGAGMLLNSVIEEKSSRILEVMLSSASVPQIMGGKILGVAAVTTTVLAVWLTLGGVALATQAPGIAADVASILLSNGMIAYLAVYFIGGYLMFATLYVTVGAFCETTREAQTLLGPMMMILSLPMIFMSQAIMHPEAPMLSTLSWVPIFTPFMMAARAATDPPLWQVAGTMALMIATTALELWAAGPAFKTGALATGRFELKTFLASFIRRGAD